MSLLPGYNIYILGLSLMLPGYISVIDMSLILNDCIRQIGLLIGIGPDKTRVSNVNTNDTDIGKVAANTLTTDTQRLAASWGPEV